jgi:hypothetical protein
MNPAGAVAARRADMAEGLQGMPHNRSLGLALRRLQLVVLVSCWTVVAASAAHVLVWSLASFTDLRYAAVPPAAGDTPLVVKSPERREGFVDKWIIKRQERDKKETREIPTGVMDGVFRIVVDWSRGLALPCAIFICPLVALGVLLGVQARADRIDRTVNALVGGMALAALALPLGGWFGLAWGQGTLADYQYLVQEVEAERAAEGFAFAFYLRYLLLPLACGVGFALVGLRFSRSLEGVLLSGLEDMDPEIEKEASNVQPSSLHGTGRTAGALKSLIGDGSGGKGQKAAVGAASAPEPPKRLI